MTYKQVVDSLPPHLKQYVVEQDYSRYTSIDQATWRFILRQLKAFLSVNAHECYLEGLNKTGINTEEIPRIEVICEKLQRFGWTALPVSGFIPPAAFMELQSLSILPIACDMRSMDHILYTPAPDIVHEAAGHAPILVDPAFAQYLKDYAMVAKKAILSKEDLEQYEAIRDLSDIKESPTSTPQEIAAAEMRLQKVNAALSFVSEAALLGRMNWWTAEYGLIGELHQPKIFGAGLLSSVGESRGALENKVKKIPLTVDCIETSYDITEPQPQLFVTPTFENLSKVLRDLEQKMAFRRGGEFGLEIAKKSRTVNTIELDNGLQIAGQVVDWKSDSAQIQFFKMDGPTQIGFNHKQIAGHGRERHAHGFSSPLGFSSEKLKNLCRPSGITEIRWPSGITLQGEFIGSTKNSNGTDLIFTFKNCTVSSPNTILFQPEWGEFDLVAGEKIISVYAGPFDRESYGVTENFVKKIIPKKEWSTYELKLHELYQKIRDLRSGDKNFDKISTLTSVIQELDGAYPNDWLLRLEVLEILKTENIGLKLQKKLLLQLKQIQDVSDDKKEYIALGLDLLNLQK